MLAYPNLLDTLREEEADQEAELEEVVELPDDTRPKAPGKGKGKKSGGVEFQRIRLEGFEDADELEIWDTKLADVKPAFMEALLRPLVESELEQAIVQVRYQPSELVRLNKYVFRNMGASGRVCFA